MDKEIQFILQQKISYLMSIGNVSMLWWVSSVVFCGTMIGAMWLNREHLRDTHELRCVGLVLVAFFTSIVGYGVAVIRYLSAIEKEFQSMEKVPTNFFVNEIRMFQLGMYIGTSSFVLVLFTWFYVWKKLIKPKPVIKSD